MGKEAVIMKNWPFNNGEKAKLIWIGEPLKQNNKWMVYVYFKGTSTTRRVILDWASIHFLSVEKYYTDGNLNNGETIENTKFIDINLNGIKPEYKERDWNIWGTGFNEKTKSKTFNFLMKGVLYSIPIIEIIRAVLAPDKFMLNRILEMDTFENYFIYELNKDKLDIHFTSEYEPKLLKGEKINHLAWILTNVQVLKMFNNVGQGIWEKKELAYGFFMDRFNIRARVEDKGSFIRVFEIVSLYKKRIKVEEINIFHPSLEESISTNDAKKRKYVNNNQTRDRELTSDADGATKESEEIDTFLISHEYERVPKIIRKKSGKKLRRKEEDKNTKTYILEDDNLRSTADTGGEDIVRGLEFTNSAEVKEKGELQEFVEILKILERRNDIKLIKIIIGGLPEGTSGKRFSKLHDGITKRRYVIGEISTARGKRYSLIEIEREDKALTTLLLEMSDCIKFDVVYSILLFGLVNESGNWSNDKIKKIEARGTKVHRIKHIKKSIFDKENHIYIRL